MLKKIIYISAVFALLSQFSVFAEQTKSVRLKFKPTNKKAFVETVKAFKTTRIGKELIKDQSFVKTRIVFNKIENGWSVVTIPLQIKMKRDELDLTNPLEEILKENQIVYEIDENGHLINVKGYENIRKALYLNFKKEYADAISKLYDKEAMKKKASLEWERKTGNYAGKLVHDNEVIKDVEKIYISDKNSLKCNITTRFVLNETFEGNNAVRIIINYENADKDKIPDIRGKAEIIMNPSNMDIYSQSLEKDVVFMHKDENGKSVKVEVSEKRDYSYNYSSEVN